MPPHFLEDIVSRASSPLTSFASTEDGDHVPSEGSDAEIEDDEREVYSQQIKHSGDYDPPVKGTRWTAQEDELLRRLVQEKGLTAAAFVAFEEEVRLSSSRSCVSD